MAKKVEKLKNLIELIGKIIHEEYSFRYNLKLIQVGDDQIKNIHLHNRDCFLDNEQHRILKERHDRLFIQHQDMQKDHTRLVKYCFLLLTQIEQEYYDVSQYANDELHLQKSLQLLTEEHSDLLNGLLQTRREHLEFQEKLRSDYSEMTPL